MDITEVVSPGPVGARLLRRLSRALSTHAGLAHWVLPVAAFLLGVTLSAVVFVGVWRHAASQSDRAQAARTSADHRLRQALARVVRLERTVASDRALLARARAAEHTVAARLASLERAYSGEDFAEWNDFSLSEASDGRPVTRRLHIAFVASSRDRVEAFWRVGTEAGYRDDGAPGPRPQYSEDYYGAFLLDPDGNSAEDVHHGTVRDRGVIDHLWIRVTDVPRSQRFYETISPFAGFRLNRTTADRSQF